MVSDQNICTRHRRLRQFSSEGVQCVHVLYRSKSPEYAHNNKIYRIFIILSLKKKPDESTVLWELPVGNVGSAPRCLVLNSRLRRRSGASAASPPMQGLCCSETAAPSRAPVPSSQSSPAGTFWGGTRRQLLPDGGRTSAGSGSHAGASTAALGLRDVRVSRTSVAEPEHFHRGGPNETIAHTGVAHEHVFRVQIAVDLLVFLGR